MMPATGDELIRDFAKRTKENYIAMKSGQYEVT